MLKDIIIVFVALVLIYLTYILYKRFIEIKKILLLIIIWAGYISYSSVMIYKQYLNGAVYYNYIDFILWIIVHQILLSLYLLFSKDTKNENTPIQIRVYTIIAMVNPIALFLIGFYYV